MLNPIIDVSVQSEYLPAQSNPEDSRFTFAYHVVISNHSAESVQLLNRKWIITDANGLVEEVIGDGVIGEQPIIAAGSQHRYSSGAILKTPLGCMQGHYGMRTLDDDHFKAAIPIFTLAVPGLVN